MELSTLRLVVKLFLVLASVLSIYAFFFLFQSKTNHSEGVRCGQPDPPVQLTSRELETVKNVGSNLSSDQLPKIVNGNHQVFSISLNNKLEAAGMIS